MIDPQSLGVPVYMSMAEAARNLGCHRNTILDTLDRRRLFPAAYVGDVPVFDWACLQAWRSGVRHKNGRFARKAVQ